jgi:hypothetical protein
MRRLRQTPSVDDPDRYSNLLGLLRGLRDDAELVARLADVESHVAAWFEGDEQAGLLAADALDQLHGILPDLGRVVYELHDRIPQLLSDLPAPPE